MDALGSIAIRHIKPVERSALEPSSRSQSPRPVSWLDYPGARFITRQSDAHVASMMFWQPIKRVIDTLPYAGYRTVAWLLGENKNSVQRIFQLKGWQVRKRRSGHRPRVQSLPSAASRPNER